MAIYLLALIVAWLVLSVAAIATRAAYRIARRLYRVRSAQFRVDPRIAKPGDSLSLSAHVAPRTSERLEVRATLRCVMFDHQPRALFANTVTLAVGADHRHHGSVALPEFALRTGSVGDDLSTLFSEEARRLLVFWSVDFAVGPVSHPKRTWLRRSMPIDVPEGRPLQTDAGALRRLVLETFASLRNEMVLNWLVRIASRDGEISPVERGLLRELLATAHGVTDPVEADARIERERARSVEIDPSLVRQHLSASERVAFYRVLFMVAWRDGTLDNREHEFLIDALRSFGLARRDVAEVEREVLRELGHSALR